MSVLCDWCRAHTAEDGPALKAHEAECPEAIAFALRSETRVLREYFQLFGTPTHRRITRVLAYYGRLTARHLPSMRYTKWGPVAAGDLFLFDAGVEAPLCAADAVDQDRYPAYCFITLAAAQAVTTANARRIIALQEEQLALLTGPPVRRKYVRAIEARHRQGGAL